MLPGKVTVPTGAAVTLNVFVPDLNRVGGAGTALAFLKKNVPITSPQLSEYKFAFVTVAVAPLDSPTIEQPLLIYPKYLSSFAKATTSILNLSTKLQRLN